MNLRNRSILLTGGGSGIGLELALILAGKGAHLVLTGRRQGPLEEAAQAVARAGARVRVVAGDVRDAGHRRSAVEAAVETFGGLDVLINNAGNIVAGRLEALEESDIRAVIEVDLIAPILFTRAALPELRRSGGGMVVNVSSGMGLIGMPFYSVYGSAKGGLARFSEALRRELLGEAIHVLSAYPAATETPMMASSKAGPELGVVRESAQEVAAAIVMAMETEALGVVTGGESRHALIALNQSDPKQVDKRFASIKSDLETAVKDHRHL